MTKDIEDNSNIQEMSDTFKVPAEHQEDISKLNAELNNLKLQLADNEITKARILQAIITKNSEVYTESTFLAKLHGIDLNDPSNGQWLFNLETMEFKKSE